MSSSVPGPDTAGLHSPCCIGLPVWPSRFTVRRMWNGQYSQQVGAAGDPYGKPCHKNDQVAWLDSGDTYRLLLPDGEEVIDAAQM